MKKAELTAKTAAARGTIRGALQTVYDALNQGHRKKLLKNEEVRRLLELYEVEVES